MFELFETSQTVSVLLPYVSDLINPLHLVVAGVLKSSNPLVNRVSLLLVLIVRQAFIISVMRVEEVDKLCLPPVVSVRTVR